MLNLDFLTLDKVAGWLAVARISLWRASDVDQCRTLMAVWQRRRAY